MDWTQLLNRLAHDWYAWAVEAGWQAAVVGVVALLVVTAGRRLPSPLRYALLLVAALKFVVPPDLSTPIGIFSQRTAATTHTLEVESPTIPPPSPAALPIANEMEAQTAPHTASKAVPSVATAPLTTPVRAPETPLSSRAWLFLLGALGTLLTGAWIAHQLHALRRLERDARPAPDALRARLARVCAQLGVHRVPELLVARRSTLPIAYGIFRRRILLPTSVTRLPEREIDCILAHEAVHHRRGDLVVNAAVRSIQALWWFHPVVWLLGRTINQVREECCDDLLLARGLASDEEYCDTLLRTAALCGAAYHGAMAAGIGGHPLGRRFARIMDPKQTRAARLSLAGLLTVAVVSGVILPGTRSEAAPTTASHADDLTFRGRVVDADGRPVAGARLFVTTVAKLHPRVVRWRATGHSGTDGKFEVTINLNETELPQDSNPTLAAVAEGHGLAWHRSKEGSPLDDIVLHLPTELPFEGRVVDLEGNPLAGVRVRPLNIRAPTDGRLDAWIDHVKAGKANAMPHIRLYTAIGVGLGGCEPATTDAEGRFVLGGLGAERVVRAVIEGPTIETALVTLVTRKMESFDSTYFIRRQTNYGISARIFVAPTRPLIGRITDAVTGEPVAGITIAPMVSDGNPLQHVKATTDSEGRYRMTGLRIGAEIHLRTAVDLERRYLPCDARVPKNDGLSQMTQDFALHKGVLVTGTVRESKSGKPVRSARIAHYAMTANPFMLRGRVLTWDPSTQTRRDGSFRLLVLPGEGVISVFARGYLTLDQLPEAPDLASLPTSVGLSSHRNMAVHVVKFTEQTETQDLKLTVQRGRPFDVRIIDAAGRPVSGAFVFDAAGRGRWSEAPLTGAEVTLGAFNAKAPRTIRAAHRERGLVGRLVLDHAGGPAILMTPGGRIRGRLIDADGLPRASEHLSSSMSDDRGRTTPGPSVPWQLRTDQQGRFDIPCLDPRFAHACTTSTQIKMSGDMATVLPGVVLFEELKIAANETKDVGDVRGREQ